MRQALTLTRQYRLATAVLVATAMIHPSGAFAMFVNHATKEINLKLIYVGPQDSGKVESLRYIYDRTDASSKGKLISVGSDTEQTLFFDFLPQALGEIRGFKVRFHLYTVAGAEQSEASTAHLLKGADGIVFVADARPTRVDADLECLARVRRAIEAKSEVGLLHLRHLRFEYRTTGRGWAFAEN